MCNVPYASETFDNGFPPGYKETLQNGILSEYLLQSYRIKMADINRMVWQEHAQVCRMYVVDYSNVDPLVRSRLWNSLKSVFRLSVIGQDEHEYPYNVYDPSICVIVLRW